jgi:hypothetical protein
VASALAREEGYARENEETASEKKSDHKSVTRRDDDAFLVGETRVVVLADDDETFARVSDYSSTDGRDGDARRRESRVDRGASEGKIPTPARDRDARRGRARLWRRRRRRRRLRTKENKRKTFEQCRVRVRDARARVACRARRLDRRRSRRLRFRPRPRPAARRGVRVARGDAPRPGTRRRGTRRVGSILP